MCASRHHDSAMTARIVWQGLDHATRDRRRAHLRPADAVVVHSWHSAAFLRNIQDLSTRDACRPFDILRPRHSFILSPISSLSTTTNLSDQLHSFASSGFRLTPLGLAKVVRAARHLRSSSTARAGTPAQCFTRYSRSSLFLSPWCTPKTAASQDRPLQQQRLVTRAILPSASYQSATALAPTLLVVLTR